jgi:lipoprotein-releasing system permease protein
MRYEWLIGLRYLRARRRERFVSLIAVISLAGVALGTFALTVVLSVMSGFQEDLRGRLLAFNPHITVATDGPGTQFDPSLAARIARMPGVAGVAPFVASQVMAVSTNSHGVPQYVSAGTLRGVIVHDNPVLRDLDQTLRSGSLESLEQNHPVTVYEQNQMRTVELPGVLIGKSLAADLGVRPGDPIVVISPASLGVGAGTPRLRRFVVEGFFFSGMYEFDSSLMFAPLPDVQALLADDYQADRGLEVRVDDLFAAPRIGQAIAAMAGPGYQVTNWTEDNAALFDALKLEKFTYFLVLLLIVLVAAFNIVATLVMVVKERRKEIAILRAMGARAASIAWIFVCEGAALGVTGTVLGVSAGFIVSFLIGHYHLIQLPPDLFMVSAVPVRLYAVNFLAVAGAAIALCLAGALYPAWQARALAPVEVLRYE